MENKTSKKRTAIVATIVAAALLLTGTFAWVLQDDITVLNEFSKVDDGEYSVDLKEEFSQWEYKRVTAQNLGDNPVIVRIRFEEFFDLIYRDGENYNASMSDAEGKIFRPVVAEDGTVTYQSSTGLSKYITFKFADGVVTMSEYQKMLNDGGDTSTVTWVIDETDGWCYYTKVLTAFETDGDESAQLLSNVMLSEEAFNKDFSAPYELDYFVNVRLQAISADLEDFGSHLNDAQWTNTDYINEAQETVLNAGRIISEDNRSDSYEILSDSTISPEALSLVGNISYDGLTPYSRDFRNEDGSVAVEVNSLKSLQDAMTDPTVHSILLINDITIPAGNYLYTTKSLGNKMIDLGGYTLKSEADDENYDHIFYLGSGSRLVVKDGKLDAAYGIAQNQGSIELDSVDAVSADIGIMGLDNSETYLNNSTVEVDGPAYYTLWGYDNFYLKMNNSKLISNTTTAMYAYNLTMNGQTARYGKIEIENNSFVSGAGEGIVLGQDWELTVTDSEIHGDTYAIAENHWHLPKNVTLENTTLTAGKIGYHKVADSPLTMKNCSVIIEDSAQDRGGLLILSGDVTLDNVNVTVLGESTGSSGIVEDTKPMDKVLNYHALKVSFNTYESINLTINGGSYKTEIPGAESVYISDSGPNLYTDGGDGTYFVSPYEDLQGNSKYDPDDPDGYNYNNSLNVTGPVEFSDDFAFAESYRRTAVSVK